MKYNNRSHLYLPIIFSLKVVQFWKKNTTPFLEMTYFDMAPQIVSSHKKQPSFCVCLFFFGHGCSQQYICNPRNLSPIRKHLVCFKIMSNNISTSSKLDNGLWPNFMVCFQTFDMELNLHYIICSFVDMIAALGETTGQLALPYIRQKMLADPEGRQILEWVVRRETG